MILIETTSKFFDQIIQVLDKVTAEQYVYKSRLLNGASIGQHLRHITELFTEMIKGYQTGVIDYEKRDRDFLVETNADAARQQLDTILQKISQPDRKLTLSTDYEIEKENPVLISTTFHREIIYNIEHTIHHMALMRIGLEADLNISLPEDFGVAPSTLKYRQSCVR